GTCKLQTDPPGAQDGEVGASANDVALSCGATQSASSPQDAPPAATVQRASLGEEGAMLVVVPCCRCTPGRCRTTSFSSRRSTLCSAPAASSSSAVFIMTRSCRQ